MVMNDKAAHVCIVNTTNSCGHGSRVGMVLVSVTEEGGSSDAVVVLLSAELVTFSPTIELVSCGSPFAR